MSDISAAIDNANNTLVGLLTSFNNEIGPDNGNALEDLYAGYGLSNPPLQSEFTALSIKDRISYRKKERVFEMRAIAVESIHNVLISINSGTGAFGNLDAVKAWALTNMGNVGVVIAGNIDAFKVIRSKLSVFITPAMLTAHAAAVHDFTQELTTQISDGNIKS